jgi:hypothetical protein
VCRPVATIPEIHVVQVPAHDADALSDAISSAQAWAPVEVPRGQRPTPIVLAVLGVLAGLGAMALGAVAVFSADSSPSEGRRAAARPATPARPGVEEVALALLAKPSTERVVFQSSGGRLVLAVGTGGRAAILLRGLERAAADKPYYAWVVAPGRAPVRAARFDGAQRAVFLSRPLGPRASVVVSTERPAAGRPGRSLVVASRR